MPHSAVLSRKLPRLLILPALAAVLAVMAVLTMQPGGVHAQGTPPIVTTVALTTNPGGGYEYGTLDVITVGVTFNEAVTVTGTPQITLEIGAVERQAEYSGPGPSTGQLLFDYMVQPVDQDDDGVSVQEDSLVLNGGTIQATDDSAAAVLSHPMQSFANHIVNTELVLISNLHQANGTPLQISATQWARIGVNAWYSKEIYRLDEFVLHVKTPSDTLEVTLIFEARRQDDDGPQVLKTFTGSVLYSGPQTFTLSDAGDESSIDLEGDDASVGELQIWIKGSGEGHVELETTSSTSEDSAGAYRWSIGDNLHLSTDSGDIYTQPTSAHLPKFAIMGHIKEVLRIRSAKITSSPYNGIAYAAGETIEVEVRLNGAIQILHEPLTVPLLLGDGPGNRREARLKLNSSEYEAFSYGSRKGVYYYPTLIFAYTVHDRDTDTDGVVLEKDPLGDTDHPKVKYALDSRVPVLLTAPSDSGTGSQEVDGAQQAGCKELHCAFMVTARAENDQNHAYFHLLDGSPAARGTFSRRVFRYAGEEYVIIASGRGVDGQGFIVFDKYPPNRFLQRLAAEIDGVRLPFSDASNDPFPWYPSDVTEETNSIDHTYWEWLPAGLTFDIGDRVPVNIIELPVTASFNVDLHPADEGESFDITVTLSDAFEASTVTLPIVVAFDGGATEADISHVPANLTFAPGQTSKTFPVTISDDSVDDDDETVTLSFGPTPRIKSGVDYQSITILINDDDDPQVAVSFARGDYVMLEGGSATVRVSLSADPERTVTIPIVKVNQGGATASDYSGVPDSVTISAGETSGIFHVVAKLDDESDTGESVQLSFGSVLPARVHKGSPEETIINIKQVLWHSDLRFSDFTAEDWGWANLRYWDDADPPATLADDNFRFRGVDYIVWLIEVTPGVHPVQPNAWSRNQQHHSSFTIHIGYDDRMHPPPSDHYRDWVLHIDGLELQFKDASRSGAGFQWTGPRFQRLFNDWTTSTVNKIAIEEAPIDHEPERVDTLPAPMQVDAFPHGQNSLNVRWYTRMRDHRLPRPTSYIIQWKRVSENWSDGAAVSQQEVAASRYGGHVTVDGLAEGALYSVRVTARNAAGDGPPSEVTLGRPQRHTPRPVSATVNGQTLTLRFNRDLDPNAVPNTNDFVVVSDGGLRMVDAATISGREVQLTLSRAVSSASTVMARYEKPTDPSGPFLKDRDGNHAHMNKFSPLMEVTNETAGSPAPLTAGFNNVPAEHDGSAGFTFGITFSESVWIGYGTPTYDLLEVTGGTVSSAIWLGRRTEEWTVTIQPDTQGDIVITLPKDRYCAVVIDSSIRGEDLVAGAPCAVGNRALTNEPTATVPGPSPSAQQAVADNTPAEGAPIISGMPQIGQTLSVVVSGISDAEGLERPRFSYQWHADSEAIRGATNATYVPTDGDIGKAITVTVAFTDDAGNAEFLTSQPTATVAAREGLNVQTASVNGTSLVLTYNEILDALARIPTSAFTVRVNGAARSVSAVAVSGKTLALTLTTAVAAGDTTTVAYAKPGGNNAVRDTLGRFAPSFTAMAAANETPPPPLTARAHEVPASHDGSAAFTFDLSFNEEPEVSYTTLRDHAFTETGGQVTGARRLIQGSNVGWEITVEPSGNDEVTLVLPPTTDCAAEGAICTGDGRMLSGRLEVSVSGASGQQETPENRPATGAPTVSGTARVGETFTASTSAVADEDRLDDATFGYQWVRVNDEGTETDISGATGNSYELTTADAGKKIKVRVSFTDDAGNAESLTSAATGTVERPLLTVSVREVPGSHDGSAAFTFELSFSEEPSLSYATLRDRAFTERGGQVTGARRLIQGSNVGWEITVEPSGNDEVTLVLPPTTDCEAEGAICTGDGRMLSGRVELAVAGP